MADDATETRALIQHWADAISTGEIDTVLADHADDIVIRLVSRATAIA